MNNPMEQINAIKNMDDFFSFVVALAMDTKENSSEWANITTTDFLGQIASWVDDYSMFDEETDWEKVEHKTIAKLLYMERYMNN